MNSSWLSLIFAVSVAAHPADTYRLDLEGPVHVTELPAADQVLAPSRIDVYKTGPGIYIDKSVVPGTFAGKAPELSLTNAVEIAKLMAVLQVNDNKARIASVTRRLGVTYHLLLFQDETKTVMHFRVFRPTDVQTKWCDVYPRSEPGFAYFNDQIGSWLREHVKTSTNQPPVVER